MPGPGVFREICARLGTARRVGHADHVPRRFNAVFTATLSAALLVAACGEDADLAGDQTTSPTETTMRASADAAIDTAEEDETPPDETTTSVSASTTTITSSTITSSTVTSSTITSSTVATPSSPTATSPVPTSAPTACRRLTDFDDDNSNWFIVNDGVMGGRSNGLVEFGATAMRFTGTVVTRGGGFTSVRRQLDGSELSGTNRIVMRVRSDDRVYALTLADAGDSRGRSISHGTDLSLDAPVDGWSLASARFDELDTTVFGQSVETDPFDPDQASEFGIIIADGVDGDFAVEIDWIDACP